MHRNSLFILMLGFTPIQLHCGSYRANSTNARRDELSCALLPSPISKICTPLFLSLHPLVMVNALIFLFPRDIAMYSTLQGENLYGHVINCQNHPNYPQVSVRLCACDKVFCDIGESTSDTSQDSVPTRTGPDR